MHGVKTHIFKTRIKQDETIKNMRRNAPPVAPLSPESVDHTQINSSSPNLNFEQSRTQIDPFYRHVSTV